MEKLPDKFKLTNNNRMALKIIKKSHWNGQIYCPHCACINDIRTHSRLKNGVKRYLCENCAKTFTDLTGTIFEKTKIPLWKWMYGIILLLESTGSISAAQLSRNIDISYPTAWNMLRKVRTLVHNKQFAIQMNGIVESDEAWFSHKQNQQIVLGMVERYGNVQFFPILDRKEDQLLLPHYWYVRRGSIVMTDSHASYGGLSTRFTHHWINHSAKEFKRNHIWTNTIEGVWGMLKGVIRTIHHGVKKKYIPLYCSLFAFRYNDRHLSPNQSFSKLLHYLCQPRYSLY